MTLEWTRYLESRGYRVIRFWSNHVMKDLESVILAIMQVLEEKPQNMERGGLLRDQQAKVTLRAFEQSLW